MIGTIFTHIAECSSIAGLLVGAVAMILVMRQPKLKTEEHGQVIDRSPKPLPLKQVANGKGRVVDVDEYGRFRILKTWKEGSRIYLYGRRSFRETPRVIGVYRLVRHNGKDWAPLIVPEPK